MLTKEDLLEAGYDEDIAEILSAVAAMHVTVMDLSKILNTEQALQRIEQTVSRFEWDMEVRMVAMQRARWKEQHKGPYQFERG